MGGNGGEACPEKGAKRLGLIDLKSAGIRTST